MTTAKVPKPSVTVRPLTATRLGCYSTLVPLTVNAKQLRRPCRVPRGCQGRGEGDGQGRNVHLRVRYYRRPSLVGRFDGPATVAVVALNSGRPSGVRAESRAPPPLRCIPRLGLDIGGP